MVHPRVGKKFKLEKKFKIFTWGRSVTMQGGNRGVYDDFWACRRCTFHNKINELNCLCCSAPKTRDSGKKTIEKPSIVGKKRKGTTKQGKRNKRSKGSPKDPNTTPVPSKKVIIILKYVYIIYISYQFSLYIR